MSSRTTATMPAGKTLFLTVKDNLSFSNGKPLTARNIQVSLKVFMGSDLFAASKLSKTVKNVRVSDEPGRGRTAGRQSRYPQPAHRPGTGGAGRGRAVLLRPLLPPGMGKERPPDPAGQPLLRRGPDLPGHGAGSPSPRARRPTCSWPAPSQFKDNFREFDSGIYQNIYLCFLQGDVGQNTKIALYSLLKRFNEAIGVQIQGIATP